MGAATSKNKNIHNNIPNSDLATEIDRIASKYILSQNFTDMNKLSEKGHCDKLVILTAKIISQQLTPLEQKEVADRIKPKDKDKGEKLEEKTAVDAKADAVVEPKAVDENAVVEPKAVVNAVIEPKAVVDAVVANAVVAKIEPSAVEPSAVVANAVVEPVQKGGATEEPTEADACIQIAKYYVKIAHLYAAIMKTINPVIVSKDDAGKYSKYDLSNKQNMPSSAEITNIQHNNFCTTRLNTLLQESDYNVTDPKNKLLKIQPRFCSVNLDAVTKKPRKFYEGDKNKKNGMQDERPDMDDRRDTREQQDMREQQGGLPKKEKKKETKKKDDDDEEDEDEDEDEEKASEDKEKEKKKKGKNITKKNKDKESNEEEDEDEDEDEADKEGSEADKSKQAKQGQAKQGQAKQGQGQAKQGQEQAKQAQEKEKVKEKVKETPLIIDSSEVGIPELKKLYYDVYDEQKNEFTKMSPEMIEIYQKDVEMFYKTFTGKEVETDENGNKKITTFEQIPLREFHKSEGCKPDGIYTKPYEGSLNIEFGQENLFQKYATHVNKMMNQMNANQDKLLAILKKLFIFKKVNIKKKEEEEKKKKEEEEKKKEEPLPVTTEASSSTDESTGESSQKEMAGPDIIQGYGQAPAAAPPPPNAAPPPPNAAPNAPPNAPPPNAPTAVAPADANAETSKINLEQPATDVQVGGADEIEEVTINPNLDEELLNSLINSARKLIVNLYITCENDFLEGIHIFEAIVAVQLGKTTNSQINILNNMTLEYLAEEAQLKAEEPVDFSKD